MTIRLMHSSLFVLVMATIAAVPASAQDERRVGLVAAAPSSVGVVWQVTDGFALRGDASFDWSTISTESSTGFTFTSTSVPPPFTTTTQTFTTRSETSSRSAALGVSTLIDLHRRDQFRVYAAPRAAIAFSRSTTTTTQDAPSELQRLFPRGPTTRSSRAPAFSLVLGASTRIGERFGVFGEIGVGYSRASNDDALLDITSHAFGSRSSVGAILFF